VRDGDLRRHRGNTLNPVTGPLLYSTCPLKDDVLGLLQARARASGRLIERDGLLVLGFGVAGMVELANGLIDSAGLSGAVAKLGAIAPLDGARPVASSSAFAPTVPLALGALPFDRRVASRLVIPELTVVARAGQRATALAVGPATRVNALLIRAADGEAPGAKARANAELAPPDEFRLASARPHQDFLNRVSNALAEIESGRLDKIVLAREVTVEANRPLRQGDLFARLRSLHPSCATFALDGFIGASPELLICREGARISSRPLAGTAARSGDPEADAKLEAALLASSKERSEHRVVVETIAAALAPVVEHLEVPDEPAIMQLRNVSHLGTSMHGLLSSAKDGYLNALELVGLLHPTPAVAGTPVDLALDYLAKLEDIDRDRYAGPLGWVDAKGDGEWYLGIRSAIVAGSSARLFAGVGIVADSDPAAELAETQLKLQAFLAAAVRP
jgi:menaquinone-specific isochorismate synthase